MRTSRQRLMLRDPRLTGPIGPSVTGLTTTEPMHRAGYDALTETAWLLRVPANATRLFESLA